MNENMS
jgi:hypothetical protein